MAPNRTAPHSPFPRSVPETYRVAAERNGNAYPPRLLCHSSCNEQCSRARNATPPLRHHDRVAWPGTGAERREPQPGVFFSPDVYDGVPDLPRGSVKFLRVFQMDHKTYFVPVEADGSVHFVAPAGKALHFQLLDERYRCLQTMRSFTGVMPGE